MGNRVHENTDSSDLETKSGIRDRIDLLQSRIGLLRGRDKLLMTMYVQNANTFRQMARLAGVNEATIARRIHKITKRLLDGEYITCLRNRREFTPDELRIAKDYFLGGLSQEKIAQKRSCSRRRVRETLKKIAGLVQVKDAKPNRKRRRGS